VCLLCVKKERNKNVKLKIKTSFKRTKSLERLVLFNWYWFRFCGASSVVSNLSGAVYLVDKSGASNASSGLRA